jgi:hypothetical protein
MPPADAETGEDGSAPRGSAPELSKKEKRRAKEAAKKARDDASVNVVSPRRSIVGLCPTNHAFLCRVVTFVGNHSAARRHFLRTFEMKAMLQQSLSGTMARGRSRRKPRRGSDDGVCIAT